MVKKYTVSWSDQQRNKDNVPISIMMGKKFHWFGNPGDVMEADESMVKFIKKTCRQKTFSLKENGKGEQEEYLVLVDKFIIDEVEDENDSNVIHFGGEDNTTIVETEAGINQENIASLFE